jgi:hypothetical protein
MVLGSPGSWPSVAEKLSAEAAHPSSVRENY